MVPGAFSPNGDGHNDNLSLLVRGIFNLNYFYIYNRWGNLVFQTGNITQGWDGKYNSKEQEVGVYVYVLSGTDYVGNPINRQGNVTLVR